MRNNITSRKTFLPKKHITSIGIVVRISKKSFYAVNIFVTGSMNNIRNICIVNGFFQLANSLI